MNNPKREKSNTNIIKNIRNISRIVVISGFIYIIYSLILLALGHPHEHAHVMLMGGLLLLPHGVALSYIASATHPQKAKMLMGSSILSLFLIPLVLINYIIFIKLFIIISIITSISTLITLPTRRHNIKFSLFLILLTYLLIYLNLIIILLINIINIFKFSQISLLILFSYPIPLIYAVTANALPGTFHDKPIKSLTLINYIILYLSQFIIIIYNIKIYIIISSLTLIIYIISCKLYKLKKYMLQMFPSNREMHNKPAWKGIKYFIDGHYFVLLNILIYIIYMILYIIGKCTILCPLHAAAMGIVSIHFMIHGPMMLPVILGIKHRKNYTILPYILNTLGVIIWPLNGAVSYALYILSLIAAIRIVK